MEEMEGYHYATLTAYLTETIWGTSYQPYALSRELASPHNHRGTKTCEGSLLKGIAGFWL